MFNLTSKKKKKTQGVRWPIRDAAFFLFPRFSCQVSTAVNTFSPLWKGFHRGGNLYTTVETFTPRRKRFHCGEKVYTAVETFSPRWKCFLRGIKVYTTVTTFSPRWKRFHPGGNLTWKSRKQKKSCMSLMGDHRDGCLNPITPPPLLDPPLTIVVFMSASYH